MGWMSTSTSAPFDCRIVLVSCFINLLLDCQYLGHCVFQVFVKGKVSKPGMPLSSLSLWREEDEVVFRPPSLLTLLWTTKKDSYEPGASGLCPLKGVQLRRPQSWQQLVAQVRPVSLQALGDLFFGRYCPATCHAMLRSCISCPWTMCCPWPICASGVGTLVLNHPLKCLGFASPHSWQSVEKNKNGVLYIMFVCASAKPQYFRRRPFLRFTAPHCKTIQSPMRHNYHQLCLCTTSIINYVSDFFGAHRARNPSKKPLCCEGEPGFDCALRSTNRFLPASMMALRSWIRQLFLDLAFRKCFKSR